MGWTSASSAEKIGNAHAVVDLSLFDSTAVASSCGTAVVSSCSSTSGGATDMIICCMAGEDFSAADLSHCCQGSQTRPTTSDGIGFSIEMQCCERKADNRSTIELDQHGSDGDFCIDSVGVRCAEISRPMSAEASFSSPEFVFACSTVQTGSTTAADNAKPVFQTVSYFRIPTFGCETINSTRVGLK